MAWNDEQLKEALRRWHAGEYGNVNFPSLVGEVKRLRKRVAELEEGVIDAQVTFHSSSDVTKMSAANGASGGVLEEGVE